MGAPFPGRLASFDPRHFFHFVEAIHGRVGDVVFKTYGRGRDRKIVLTRVPCFDGYVPTAAQRSRRNRMREATAFAHRVYADAAARAFYAAAAKKLGRHPFRLAISDFLRGHERLREPIIARLSAAPPATGQPESRPPFHQSILSQSGAQRTPRLAAPRRRFRPSLKMGMHSISISWRREVARPFTIWMSGYWFELPSAELKRKDAKQEYWSNFDGVTGNGPFLGGTLHLSGTRREAVFELKGAANEKLPADGAN